MTTVTKSSGLIRWLYGLTETQDRGRLAALRRGLLLEPAQFYELYRVVPAQFLEEIGREEAERRLMLAALFASHPVMFSNEEIGSRHRNLGESLRLLAKRKNPDAQPADLLPESLKRRMDALLASQAENLFEHLRQVIRLLKSAEVPVDWEQLLWDLRGWDHPDRRVQWWWSRSFYVGLHEKEGGESRVS